MSDKKCSSCGKETAYLPYCQECTDKINDYNEKHKDDAFFKDAYDMAREEIGKMRDNY